MKWTREANPDGGFRYRSGRWIMWADEYDPRLELPLTLGDIGTLTYLLRKSLEVSA